MHATTKLRVLSLRACERKLSVYQEARLGGSDFVLKVKLQHDKISFYLSFFLFVCVYINLTWFTGGGWNACYY
jgi:hypothetical protein